jgi:DNA-binding protein H-NS
VTPLTENRGKVDVVEVRIDHRRGTVSNLKSFDFNLFSDKHLVDLEAQVREELKRRRKLAQTYRQLSERGGPVYRNPSNSAETWTGRGRQPKWVRDALAAGLRLEDLTIDQD